jgi:hypothetical protein
MARFIIKKNNVVKSLQKSIKQKVMVKQNEEKNIKDMDTKEKIMLTNAVLNQTDNMTKIKKIRKEKGLIEKTESSKIILTEDNRELLND